MTRDRMSAKSWVIAVGAAVAAASAAPAVAQTAPPFPARNAIAPPMTTYEDGMARIKARDDARPKAVMPGFMRRPADAGQPPASVSAPATPPTSPAGAK